MRTRIATLLVLFSLLAVASAREAVTLDLKVDQAARQALVFPPDKADKKTDAKVPLVFGFHGHGGSARQASLSFRLHDAWTDALVVYPQGIPTPGQLTDPEGKRNGWQALPGAHEDRDLKFFDVLLAELKRRYPIDEKRIFVMGHSNGGGFTYLLWATRSKDITAVAPCAAVAPMVVKKLTPKPCLHLAGKNDPLVRYSWQEHMMAAVKKINLCEDEGKVWAPGCMRYEAKDKSKGAPMLQYIHDQGHRYPDQATALIVKFFREVSPK